MTAAVHILPRPDNRDELRRWAFAGAVVLAVHCGLLGSYLLLPPPEQAGSPAAPAVIIDLAPMAVAPQSQADVAPDQDMIESQLPPETQPQAEPQVEPLPKIEQPSEVVLPAEEPKPLEQKAEEKPVEKPPEPVKVERKPPAPKTSAAPRSEQRKAPRPAAPAPGAAVNSAAMVSWMSLVSARLQSVKRYPVGESGQGVVTLSFTVDRSGRVVSRSIARSSGVAAFDREVLDMVMRAQPFPAFPAAMTQSSQHLTVPVRFSRR